LTVARATPHGRITLLNRRLTRRLEDGSSEAVEVSDPEELLRVLERAFGIVLPAGTRFTCPGLEW
jgi:arylamine N-acetyltransferase